MTQTSSRNKLLKNKNDFKKIACNKQRNYDVGVLRRAKKEYYDNLNEKM